MDICLDETLTNAFKTYLYGPIDNDIYMKIPEEFKLFEANSTNPGNM